MRVVAVVALLAAVAGSAQAAAITPGNIVLYRVGDGAAGLVNTGAAVFVDEFTPAGVLVQSIAMPTVASGGNNQLIASGTASSEGMLTVSPNGQYVALTGYARNLGGTGSVVSTTSATVGRTVGILNVGTGGINTSTALTNIFSGNNPRSAVTTNGTDIWITGAATSPNGGIGYTTLGSTTGTDLGGGTYTNGRQVNIFGGQLFASSSTGTGTFKGVEAIGTGTPNSGSPTITRLAGLSDAANASSYGFFMADLNASVPGVDTMYVADDNGTVGGIQKYSLVGGTWVASGTLGTAADSYRGLTGYVDALGQVQLFATRKGGTAAIGGGELVSVLDSTGYNATIAGTINLLATAGTNTSFRGVGYIPSVPAPASAMLLISGGLLATRRRRAR